jgi:hypothetical protein
MEPKEKGGHMKRRRGAFALSLAAALAAGISALPARADPAQRTVSPVTLFMSTTVVPDAWSALVRTDTGIAGTLHTSGLAPGGAATLWWVVFNNPAYCTQGLFPQRCGAGDLANPLVQASVQFASGHVIGGEGVADYGAYLSEGDTSGCAAAFLPCSGLIDPRNAVVHLIVRSHGQALPGAIDEQISSFDGGCNPTCMNVQAAVFEP